MTARGPRGTIADVAGVGVAHFTLARGDRQTGATVIAPYPLETTGRRMFIGSHARGGDEAWTGRHIGRDFGTFSSPIALVNATTVGIAYDALISLAHRRDDWLPVDTGWPPIVIGIDDGYLNDLRARAVTHDDVLAATVRSGAPPADPAPLRADGVGSVGIGRGLCALGGKGGVGQASRVFDAGGERFTIGALIAAAGGPAGDSADAPTALSPSYTIALATDLPLLPGQLRRVAEASIAGVDRVVSRAGPGSRRAPDRMLALAFSTSTAIDGASDPQTFKVRTRVVGDRHLAAGEAAAAAVARAALRDAIASASEVVGRAGRRVAPLAPERIAALFE